ncbi:MAG TPA: hypothetical protein VFO55_07875 [Gemmatimonadaceae bacterium]|nr:hypothetical protein [Gemmatimonadaceae bacterium]
MATIRLQLTRRGPIAELADLPWRTIAGVAALVVASTILAVRIQHLRARNTVEWSERTAQFAVVKRYSDRVLSYAEQYGRPVFAWTGVRHSSAAESTLYENLRLDLRDPRIRYWYGEDAYVVAWYDPEAGRTGPGVVAVTNPWPPEARFYAHVRWVVNHPVPPGIRERLARPQPAR